MTEEQIELNVEHQFNRLDKKLMAGKLTQEQYDHEAKLIHEWAEAQRGLREWD